MPTAEPGSLTATAMVWHGVEAGHEPEVVHARRLGAGEALVRIDLATICGSDVHTCHGRRPAATPLVLGHEQVGRVVHADPAAVTVEGEALRPGMRVVWTVGIHCGHCDRCRRGIPQKCRTLAKYGHQRTSPGWRLSGGFASHVHLRRGTGIVEVPESIPDEVAAPASCASATAVAAIEAADVPVGRGAVLVIGAGMLGLTTVAMLHDLGALVLLCDPDPARRRLAERFGAAATFEPRMFEADSPGRTGSLGDIEVIATIEMSGSAAGGSLAINALATGGVAVLAGSVAPGPCLALDPERVVRRMLTIRGVHNYRPDQLRAAVEYLGVACERWPFADLVGVVEPMERIEAALAIAVSGAHVRVGLRP